MTTLPGTLQLADLAGSLAATAVANIDREFPCAPAHVVLGPHDTALPRQRHPSFYGAYDWHSSVHMHWLLVRLLRSYADRLDVAAAREALDRHLAPEPLLVEADYLRADPSFERPYGWAWLLTLAAECASSVEPAGARWAAALEPAVDVVHEHVLGWLPRAGRPVREGGHANTAFALGLVLDAAGPLGRRGLAAAVRQSAAAWFLGDEDAPASWEPSGQDFLSPALCQADLVRRLLPADRFANWLDAFLPGLAGGTSGRPAAAARALLHPVPVADRADGQLGHLDGLNLSRAAALRSLAAALPSGDRRAAVLAESAGEHLAAGLSALAIDGYLSSHWLGTFAVLALTAGTE